MNFMHIKQWISVGILSVLVLLSNVLAHEGCASHENCASIVSAPVVASNGAAAGTEKNVAVSTDAAKDAGQAKQAGQLEPLLLQVLGDKKEEIAKALDSYFKNSLQYAGQQKKARQDRQLNLLPEPLRTNLQHTLAAHMNAARQLKLDVFLSGVCRDFFERIQKLLPDDAPCKKDAIAAVELLNRALNDGSFMRVVTAGQLLGDMQDPQHMLRQLLQGVLSPVSEQITFTEQDIVSICTKLELVRHYAQERRMVDTLGTMGFLADDTATLIQYLNWAAKKDIRSLSTACIAKVSPLLDECLANIKTMVMALADKRLQVNQAVDFELAEALDAWIEELKAYAYTLTAFRKVVKLSGIDLSYVMQGLSYAYEVADGFLKYSRNSAGYWNLERVKNTCFWIDMGMRCAMLGLTAVHRIGEVAGGEVQKCILGSGSLAKFVNPFEEPSYALTLLMTSTSTLMHPSQQRLNLLERGFFRVSGVLLWNYIVQVAAQRQNGATTLKDRWLPSDRWPANDEWLQTALILTVKELQWFIADELIAGVKCGNHPRDGKPCQRCIMLENLEKYSLGIVKPDLIHLALELLATMALFNQDAETVLGRATAPGVDGYVWNYVMNGYTDYFTFTWAYAGNKALVEKDAKLKFYVEYQLVRYLFESVGAFCGKNVVHKPIYGVLSGTAKAIGSLLRAAGRFAFDLTDEDEQAIKTQYQRYIVEMRAFMRLLFCEQSPERVVVVGMLKNMRLLSEDDSDPKKVNFSIIALVLYYLSQYHLITHVQEAQLYEEYNKNPTDEVKFLDVVFDIVDKNKASITGGIVGGLAGNVLAAVFMKNRVATK